ncbi:hypothetical protein Tco_1403559 [Tanacetum coccineum]
MIRMRDDISEEDIPPRRRFVLTAPPPRDQYDFVDTIMAGQGLIRSPGHDARAIVKASDRAEAVGYVRALHDFEHRMMTSIEEVNLRVSYQAQVRRQESADFYLQLLDAWTDRRDIRLEIDVRQKAEDDAVRQMMCTQVLEAKARIDTVEDVDSSSFDHLILIPCPIVKHGIAKRPCSLCGWEVGVMVLTGMGIENAEKMTVDEREVFGGMSNKHLWDCQRVLVGLWV